MAYHVDVISNELMTGEQRLLGRVHVEPDGHLHIEAAVEDQLLDTLKRIVPEIDPNDDPVSFVELLPERVDYTYMVASNPHEMHDCAFPGGIGQAIKITDAESQHSAQHA